MCQKNKFYNFLIVNNHKFIYRKYRNENRFDHFCIISFICCFSSFAETCNIIFDFIIFYGYYLHFEHYLIVMIIHSFIHFMFQVPIWFFFFARIQLLRFWIIYWNDIEWEEKAIITINWIESMYLLFFFSSIDHYTI